MFEKVALDRKIDLLRFFRSHMADRAIHQFEPRLNRTLSDFFHFFGYVDSFNVFVRAEFEVNFIRIVDRFLRQFFADEKRQIAAHFGGKRQFPVGKRARARKTRGDMAERLAVHAFSRHVFGASAIFHRFPFFHDKYALFTAAAQHFECGKNTRRPRADNYYVFLHCSVLSPRFIFFAFIKPVLPAGRSVFLPFSSLFPYVFRPGKAH